MPSTDKTLRALLGALLIAGAAASARTTEAPQPGPTPAIDPSLYEALELRLVGPHRGGRVTAVAGVPQDARTFYLGSTGGGVWKTTDAGLSWKNVSDEHFRAGSVGAVAVAPSDPNVVYAGMGSACIRGNVSAGDGVYRSTDAGATWSHAGLADAGQIGRVQVHPQDPDRVYVAALGHAFGPNAERGVFRSSDGGQSWSKVLFVSEHAGAVDLAMDPANPRVLYAAIWQAERKPWTATSGGEDSGLWKSSDGGDTWEELEEGLPAGILGRIGIAVSAARPGRVWALVEAEDGGLYRSDDGGETFRRINQDRNLRQRAWYYTHVVADPKDAETLWVLNVGLWRSHDGGKSFEPIRAPHGDHHDLWIHPGDPAAMINGNDGGANVTTNGGQTWTSQANQPTAEVYRVSVDDRFPYWLYGAQQDNTAFAIASRSVSSGITTRDWHVIGGCESGHVAVDPRDPDVTYAGCYGGSLGRHDFATGQEREVMAWPQVAVGQAPRDLKYRFQWNAPTRISPHDPQVLYHCAQVVLRSTDEGQSWQEASPDLTRNDPAKQDYSGGPITRDNTGVEVYGTIFAFEESPLEKGVLWAGSDDGLVHVSRDAGATWTDVTPAGMPEWATINAIEVSAHAPGRVFLAAHRYRLDDVRPYLFRTDDYGATWKPLTDGSNGIPEGHFTRVVREDPESKGLLYAGTEYGLYVSFDDGERWQSLQLELPVTPITDLAVKDGDLVVATQGRSLWILDDLSPLRELQEAAPQIAAATVHLYQPRDAVRFGGGEGGQPEPAAGKNPPYGVVLFYTLGKELAAAAAEPEPDGVETGAVATSEPDRPGPEVTLEILDAEGAVLRRWSSREEERRAPNPFLRFFPELAEPAKLPVEPGMNRWVWNLRLPDAEVVEDAVLWGETDGPKVPPGSYQARLTAGDVVQTERFTVLRDPRLSATDADLVEQYELAKKTWELLSDSHRSLERLRGVRAQVAAVAERAARAGLGADLEEPARALGEKLTALEATITEPRIEASQDVLNFPPQIDGQIAGLLGLIGTADARPTDAAVQRYEQLATGLSERRAELGAILDVDLAAFNRLVDEKGVPAVVAGAAAAPGSSP